jgi:hypothetical protein
MEATCSFETSVDFRRTTRRYIPEDKLTSESVVSTCNDYTQYLSSHSLVLQNHLKVTQHLYHLEPLKYYTIV